MVAGGHGRAGASRRRARDHDRRPAGRHPAAHAAAAEAVDRDRGVRFRSAFVPNPSCCPSRASVAHGRLLAHQRCLEERGPLRRHAGVRRFLDPRHLAPERRVPHGAVRQVPQRLPGLRPRLVPHGVGPNGSRSSPATVAPTTGSTPSHNGRLTSSPPTRTRPWRPPIGYRGSSDRHHLGSRCSPCGPRSRRTGHSCPRERSTSMLRSTCDLHGVHRTTTSGNVSDKPRWVRMGERLDARVTRRDRRGSSSRQYRTLLSVDDGRSRASCERARPVALEHDLRLHVRQRAHVGGASPHAARRSPTGVRRRCR